MYDESMFETLIECAVCLNQLDEQNRVLPCQHTFCLKCLYVVVESKGHLQCPECRKDYSELSLKDLPKNYLLVRILEGLKNNKRQCSEVRPDKTCVASAENLKRNDTAKRLSAKVKYEASLNQPCARGLYHFKSNEEGDLPFSKGDLITLVHEIDDNWWEGVLKGKRGSIPKVFVEVLVPLPKIEDNSLKCPFAKALYSYESKDEVELISFKEGDIIGVIKKVDDNWFEGVLGGQYGIFPVNFVQLNQAGEEIMHLDVNSDSSISDEEMEIKSPEKVRKTSKLSKPGNFFNESQYLVPKRHTIHVENPNDQLRESRRALNLSDDGEQPHYRLRTLSQGRELANSSQGPQLLTESPMVNVSQDSDEEIATLNADSLNSSHISIPTLSLSAVHNPTAVSSGAREYTALFTYSPAKDDELALIQGDQYYVVEKYLDGWYKGIHMRSQQSGVFPGNYVRQSSKISPQILQQVISSPSRNVIGYGSSPSSPVAASSFEYPLQRNSLEIPDALAASSMCRQQNGENIPTRAGVSGLFKMLKKNKRQLSQPAPPTPPTATQSPPSYYHSSMPGPAHHRTSRPSPIVPSEPPPPYTPTPVIDETQIPQSTTNSVPTGEKFRAIAIFPASNENEISLRVGDIVYVTKKYMDGWYTGVSCRTGATGVFPSIFVEACI